MDSWLEKKKRLPQRNRGLQIILKGGAGRQENGGAGHPPVPVGSTPATGDKGNGLMRSDQRSVKRFKSSKGSEVWI